MNALLLADVPGDLVSVQPSLTAVRTADEDCAFGRELAAQHAHLVRFARRLCGCPVESEDLAAEAMLKAWAARDRFQPGTRLGAWTQMILRNLFLSKARRGRFSGGAVEDLPIAMLPVSGPTQSAVIDLADAMRALALLPRDQRLAMELVAGGATYEEAAEELNCSVGTIKSKVARGRDRLHELIS